MIGLDGLDLMKLVVMVIPWLFISTKHPYNRHIETTNAKGSIMKTLQKILAVLAITGGCAGVVVLFAAMLLPYGAAAASCFGVAIMAIPVSCMVGWMALLCDS